MNPFASEFVPTWGNDYEEPKPAAPKPTPAAARPEQEEEWNESRDGPMDPELAAELAEIKAAEERMKKVNIASTKREEVAAVNDEDEEKRIASAIAKVSASLDQREHVNIVFIGHVDAGKSTISGRILFSTGMVDQRLIEKYQREAKEQNRESWYLAYIMDVNEEEKARGKTVELGKAGFSTKTKRYTILDAPGHKSYVPNMISGASQADVGVLVISAKKGEFESGFEKGGQTKEHAMLAKTLGIGKLIVVVNKMDEGSVNWSKERFEEIQSKLNPYLKSVGFNLKKSVQFIPISGYTGANICEKAKDCTWYDGPSLIQALDELPALQREAEGPIRLPISSCYKDGATMNVSGKLECGTLVANMNLLIQPGNVPVTVVGISIDENRVDAARPGENLVVSLKGVDEGYVHPGYVLSSRKNPCLVSSVFLGKVVITELLPHKPLLSNGYSAVLHLHSESVECEVVDLAKEYDKKTQQVAKKHPPFVKNGAIVDIKIRTEHSICLEPFETRPQMGRFTLRDEGKTIAIGKVVKVSTKHSEDTKA